MYFILDVGVREGDMRVLNLAAMHTLMMMNQICAKRRIIIIIIV